jgi:hypothetical protein
MSGRYIHLSVPASATNGGDCLPAPDLVRLAEHVAVGRVPFPTDLLAQEGNRLGRLVRRLRRDRLVRLIAAAIAADLVAPTREREEPC